MFFFLENVILCNLKRNVFITSIRFSIQISTAKDLAAVKWCCSCANFIQRTYPFSYGAWLHVSGGLLM